MKTFCTPLMLLALAVSPAAHAQSADPIELWGGFSTADSKADIKAFKAKQPKRKVELIPGCIAEMGWREKKKRLVTIIFLGLDRDADCHRRLLADLMKRPDKPEIKGITFGSVIGDGMGGSIDTISEGAVLIWRDGDKKTKLIKTPSSGYNLIFTVRED
jgi:hypothetical protein